MPSGLSWPLSPSVSLEVGAGDAAEVGLGAGRRLPDAPGAIGARIDAGSGAGRSDDDVQPALVDGEAREVDGAVILDHADAEGVHAARRALGGGPGIRRVHDQEGAPALAEDAGVGVERLNRRRAGRTLGRQDEKIEQVDIVIDHDIGGVVVGLRRRIAVVAGDTGGLEERIPARPRLS